MVTLRVRSQDAGATGKVPPLYEKEVAVNGSPGVPAGVSVPPQVLVLRLSGAAMYMPDGRVSVKAMPVRMALFGLVRLMSRVEDEPPNTV